MFSRVGRSEVRDGRKVFTTTARGLEVLRDPALNKGAAFSADERDRLRLAGLVPPGEPASLEGQLKTAYAQYSERPSDLDRHVYMWSLHDTNVTLF